MRIKSGVALMCSYVTEGCESNLITRPSVGDFAWNRQLNFGAGTTLAPIVELRADSLPALTNATQTPVPGTPAFLQNFGVDAYPIVPNTRTKRIFIVSNLGFDAFCVCVLKRVA